MRKFFKGRFPKSATKVALENGGGGGGTARQDYLSKMTNSSISLDQTQTTVRSTPHDTTREGNSVFLNQSLAIANQYIDGDELDVYEGRSVSDNASNAAAV